MDSRHRPVWSIGQPTAERIRVHTAKYNLGFDVLYEPYESVEGRYHYKTHSTDSRGRLRPMYERVQHHGHNGITATTARDGQHHSPNRLLSNSGRLLLR